MPQVDLTELEVIRRFSLATRGATADLDEVVEALQADLDALTTEIRPKRRASEVPAAEADEPPPPRTAKKAAKRAAKRSTRGKRASS